MCNKTQTNNLKTLFMAKSTKSTSTSFATKTINGKRHMICQNSSKDSKYFSGHVCDNYVPASSTDVVSILCSSCTSVMCSTPQTKKRVAKVAAPARKKATPKKTTTPKATATVATDAPKRKVGRPRKVVVA